MIRLRSKLTENSICWLLFLIPFLVQGCTKYKEFNAVFPAEIEALNQYSKIVIENPKPDDYLHQLLENALKTQLTSIHPGNIKPAKELNQLEKDIALFNYNPKIENLADSKIATLSYSIKAKTRFKRDHTSKQTVLKSCNFMTRIPVCIPIGTASLKKGKQTVNVTLSGFIALKNNEGKTIIAEFPINQTFGDSGKLVDSRGKILHEGINRIAFDFAKRIVPHRDKIKSEILRGGDSVAVKLIENNALNMAINRLDRLISKDSDPDLEDLYNLGLAYEALSEIQQALVYYEKASDIDSDQEAVKIALKRVRRIVRD